MQSNTCLAGSVLSQRLWASRGRRRRRDPRLPHCQRWRLGANGWCFQRPRCPRDGVNYVRRDHEIRLLRSSVW